MRHETLFSRIRTKYKKKRKRKKRRKKAKRKPHPSTLPATAPRQTSPPFPFPSLRQQEGESRISPFPPMPSCRLCSLAVAPGALQPRSGLCCAGCGASWHLRCAGVAATDGADAFECDVCARADGVSEEDALDDLRYVAGDPQRSLPPSFDDSVPPEWDCRVTLPKGSKRAKTFVLTHRPAAHGGVPSERPVLRLEAAAAGAGAQVAAGPAAAGRVVASVDTYVSCVRVAFAGGGNVPLLINAGREDRLVGRLCEYAGIAGARVEHKK